MRVTLVRDIEYPARTLALSLPESRVLHAWNVHVREDGAPVHHLHVVPASEASARTFGAVLVLDTSCSMEGRPLQGALRAAKSFAAERNPNAALGAVYFNQTATTVLPLTTDGTAIDAALAKPPKVACGTHVFDAVAQAERMLRAGGISAGSIIVLSDGADTGSTRTLERVADHAVAQNARIYSVGLQDKQYSAKTLKALAAAGHGEYAHGKPEELAPLFAYISRVLSNEYLINYTTRYGTGERVVVDVTVPGVGTASTAYYTPRLPKVTPEETSNSSTVAKIVASPATMLLLALIIAGLLGILGIALLQPRQTRLPGRIAEFVSIPELQRDRSTAAAAIAAGGGGTAEKKDWWTRFRETLEIARIDIDPGLLIVLTAVGTILVFFFIFAVTGSGWWALFALGVPYFVREWVLRSLKRQRSRFAEQLQDALQVIASALRSGHSFTGSLAVVVEGAAEPMRTEMQRVVADEQLGMPIQRSLAVVADRMASTDVDQLALVAELQRQAGGDMAEVVDRVAETVRERFDLKRLVDTLTTQGRMSRWIVSLLPIGLLLLLKLENPHYFDPLFGSTAGRVFVGLAAAWAVLGSLVIKRIVEIEV